MDVYLLLFTPPLATQLRLFEDPAVKEACLVHALKQLSLGLEVRHDFPAGTIPHVQLIARMMDHISKIMTAQERDLSAPTWSAIVSLCLGMLDYVCSTQAGKLPSEIRLTVASVAFEALVRSKTRDTELWERFGARVPNTYAATAQWAVAVVAVTRAVAAISTRRALPPCIPFAWRGVVRPTRNVTNWIDYTQDDLVFLWKNLCVLINPLRLKHIDSLNVASEALRDSAMVLGSASYWPKSMLPGGSDDPNAELDVCSREIPLGISTNAVLRVWGDALLHLCIGSSSKLMQHPLADLDESRGRAVEGLCFIMLRRETEIHCPLPYWQCFIKMMEDVCDGTSDRLRGILLLHATPLFALDLPWPYHVVRKLSLFACEVLGELSDSAAAAANAMLDEDDEDGVSAKPDAGGFDDDDGERRDGSQRAAAIREAADMQQAAIVVVTNVAIHAHMHRDATAVIGALTALQSAAERFQSIADVCQRSMCAFTHILEHVMGHTKDLASLDAAEIVWAPYDAPVMTHVLDQLILEGLAMLSAPCGTFHPQSLVIALRCVGWNAYLLSEGTLAAALGKITVFCIEACRVLDQASSSTDVEALSSLFCVAGEVIGALLENPRTSLFIKNSPDHLHNIARVIDAGFAPVKTQSLPRFQVREAAYQLLRSLEVAWWWPACDSCSATSSGITEKHLKGLCSSVQIFALGCSRVVTVAQVDHKAVSLAGTAASWVGDADVIMIVRSRTGRRAWLAKRNIDVRERPDIGQLGSPKAMPASNAAFPTVPTFALDGDVPVVNSDLLREVDAQPRTRALLDAWLANPDIQQLLAEADPLAGTYAMDSNIATISADVGVIDSLQQTVVVARHFIHDLGFPFARFKPLSLDATTIGVLKGLDRLEERHVTDVEVVFVDDHKSAQSQTLSSGAALDSRAAFDGFCDAIGWSVDDEVGEGARAARPRASANNTSVQRMYAGMRDVLRLSCSRSSIETLSCKSLNRARVLWDNTTTRYDWTAASHPPHRLLYSSVCPSLRRSAHPESSLDIVVRPLVQQGLMAVQLMWPDAVADHDVSPAMWGGPLLHNVVVTAAALPSLLREALVYGVGRLYTGNVEAPHPRCISLQHFLHDRTPCSAAQALTHVLLPQ
jgi:hypothetical protein